MTQNMAVMPAASVPLGFSGFWSGDDPGSERGAGLAGDRRDSSPLATRQFVRWTESTALVNAFGVWLDEQRSRLGGKLTYIANQPGTARPVTGLCPCPIRPP